MNLTQTNTQKDCSIKTNTNFAPHHYNEQCKLGITSEKPQNSLSEKILQIIWSYLDEKTLKNIVSSNTSFRRLHKIFQIHSSQIYLLNARQLLPHKLKLKTLQDYIDYFGMHSCPEIEYLKLDQSKAPKNEILKISNFSNLRDLSISRCEHINKLAKNLFEKITILTLRHLHHLTLICCEGLDDYTATHLGKMRSLKGLKIEQCNNLTNVNFLYSLKLTGLDLNNCSRMANVDSIQYLKNLKLLELKRCTSITKLNFLKNLQTIEVLNLGFTQVSDHDFQNAKGLTNLKKLSIASTKIQSLGVLSSFPKLEEINIGDIQLNDCNFDILFSLKNLKKLVRIPRNDDRHFVGILLKRIDRRNERSI